MMALILIILLSITPMGDAFLEDPDDISFVLEAEEKDYKISENNVEIEQIEYHWIIGINIGSNWEDAEVYGAFYSAESNTKLTAEALDTQLEIIDGEHYLGKIDEDDFDEEFGFYTIYEDTKWMDTGYYYGMYFWVNQTDADNDATYIYSWYANKAGRVLVYENITIPESQWISDMWNFILDSIELYLVYSVPGVGLGITGIRYLYKKRKERNV